MDNEQFPSRTGERSDDCGGQHLNTQTARLRAFLRAARARVSAAEAGIGARRRRRSPGLRAQDVAELVGVSDVWYSRFENGRSQFSLAALDRLATALRLTSDERAELLGLARPDVVALTARGASDAMSGTANVLHDVARFARAAADASSVGELAAGATQALRALFGPTSLGYFIANDPVAQTQHFIGVAGPARCDSLFGYEQPSAATDHVRDRLMSATYFEEADVTVSRSHDFRELNDALGTRSYHAIAIRLGEGDWNYALGCALPEARAASELERSMIVTVASIAELCIQERYRLT